MRNNVNRLLIGLGLMACLMCGAIAADTPKPLTAEELQQQVDYWKAAYIAVAQKRDQAVAQLARFQDDADARQASAPKPEKK